MPASPALSGDALDGTPTSCSQIRSSRGSCPFETATLTGVVGPQEPDGLTPDALVVSPGWVGEPPALRRPGPLSLVRRQPRQLPQPRAPSADQSCSTPPFACAPDAAFQAATGLLALPPALQLPTCVHAHWVCARPRHLPGYSPEPLSHMPPIDFCNRTTHEHACESSKPRRGGQRRTTVPIR